MSSHVSDEEVKDEDEQAKDEIVDVSASCSGERSDEDDVSQNIKEEEENTVTE